MAIRIQDHIQGMKKIYFDKVFIGILTRFEDGDWYISFSEQSMSGFMSEQSLEIILNAIKDINKK